MIFVIYLERSLYLIIKENLRKETVMRNAYEEPRLDEMLVLSESIMTGSAEEEPEVPFDNEQNDNETFIDKFFGN